MFTRSFIDSRRNWHEKIEPHRRRCCSRCFDCNRRRDDRANRWNFGPRAWATRLGGSRFCDTRNTDHRQHDRHGQVDQWFVDHAVRLDGSDDPAKQHDDTQPFRHDDVAEHVHDAGFDGHDVTQHDDIAQHDDQPEFVRHDDLAEQQWLDHDAEHDGFDPFEPVGFVRIDDGLDTHGARRPQLILH